MTRVPNVEVRVTRPPDPHLLRAAIAARLAGRPWPPGPEATVADAVREATGGERCS
ncbi:MAG: hypothetical protein QOE45_2596 [Frankiaceae bacterium]|nr:hypothetical protein [Frankiaceae bacterium]